MIYITELEEIRDMLVAKCESIRNKILKDCGSASLTPLEDQRRQELVDESWVSYLNGIDCTIITDVDIRDDFAEIINNSAQGRVCIDIYPQLLRPLHGTPYILMPKELARKVVVLGALPDTWFPEKSDS